MNGIGISLEKYADEKSILNSWSNGFNFVPKTDWKDFADELQKCGRFCIDTGVAARFQKGALSWREIGSGTRDGMHVLFKKGKPYPTYAKNDNLLPDSYRHCAACHGVGGRGDGPVAPALRRPPTDLTLLARRAGGRFDAAGITAVIDGRSAVVEHGTREMPVWGVAFEAELAGEAYTGYLAIERSQTLPDYLATLRRLGLDPGPDGPVARDKAGAAMGFVRGKHRERVGKLCGDPTLPEFTPPAGAQVAGAGTSQAGQPAAPPNPPPPAGLFSPSLLPPQEPARPEELGFRRSCRDPGQFGDLLVAVSLHVVEDEHLAHPLGERVQGPLQPPLEEGAPPRGPTGTSAGTEQAPGLDPRILRPYLWVYDGLVPASLSEEAWKRLNKPIWGFGLGTFGESHYKHARTSIPINDSLVREMSRIIEPHLPYACRLISCYANANRTGDADEVYKDGDEPGYPTAIYYANTNWEPEWAGETVLYNESKDEFVPCVYPRPGRVVIFDGRIWHNARVPTRHFGGVRITVVFNYEHTGF